MSGRLEQARRWLEQPGLDDRGVGPQALGLILEEAKKVAEGLPASLRGEILALCSRVEGDQARLLEAVRRGEADTPQAIALARSLTNIFPTCCLHCSQRLNISGFIVTWRALSNLTIPFQALTI